MCCLFIFEHLHINIYVYMNICIVSSFLSVFCRHCCCQCTVNLIAFPQSHHIRYERKKNIELSIHALQVLSEQSSTKKSSRVLLVVAGGYDERVQENREYLEVRLVFGVQPTHTNGLTMGYAMFGHSGIEGDL